jgi:hypothetical protein
LTDGVAPSQVVCPELDQAINVALKVFLMAASGGESSWGEGVETGTQLKSWKEDMTLTEFMTACFPPNDGLSLSDSESPLSRSIKDAISARKLKKRTGLRFLPTNDIRRHLELDRKRGVVLISHYTAFLKEQLRLTRDAPPQSVSEALKKGTLPR